jgi:6-phosphogluconolactonase
MHRLRGELVIRPNTEEAASIFATRLAAHLGQRLAMVSTAHLALSGGSSAKLLGAALGAETALTPSQWSRIHVWMVDERCVPADDPRLNFNLVRNVLLARTPLPSANLHPMPVLQPDGAAHYEASLQAALDARPGSDDRRLDAVVLGMGTDGHTASLFPESPALDECKRLVVLNDGDRVLPPRPRMTMTFALLNRAYLIGLLVTGESKKPALERAASGNFDFHASPVSGIIPAPGSRLLWCLDQDAAPATDRGATPMSD